MGTLRERSSAPVRASHTFAELSRLRLQVTSRDPSGLNDAEESGPVGPLRATTSPPVRTSHTFAVWSSLTVTIRVPSRLNDELKGPVCPLRERSSAPVRASHTFAV